ncbi:ARP2/3 complex subunit, putative [Trypanosoma brucei gambiense DAL972]|uniref:Arp2/3 complex 34 kDa subunit n=2 Tax=Trypanosoma brucei TaxID=5691 RepID=C9ZVN7_TRYB9|nr:ARP2/3 complex subunit, putative [Trypanosoma brucei gambiense DAL972]RHW70805.1 ARP2/3 complex subunit [Trypanosoma brucei equiperdum]CBH13475.1 ARP2/3 complex subunit, putative [Trypanosoma brucei gambiense DAL972]|eukprot:XP_011775752.1 ARP2/3 complex subunit, putative [Trypanosoma brucei gambiense DAL972]
MLLLLEREHPAVHAAVERILRGDNKIPVSVVRDFDGCEYHIRVEWDKEEKEMSQTSGVDSKDTGSGEVGTVNVGGTASVTVSLRSFTPFAELNTHGNFYEVLTTLFPSELQKFVVCDTHKGDGEDFTVAVHIPSNVPAKMLREAMHSTAQLRAWSFVPAFARQFELFLTNPEVVQPLQLHYHDGEEMVVYNNRGSFIVAIALRVSSKDDAVLTRHFLQAMVEVRKHERSFCGSSAFIFEQGGPPDSVVAVTGPRGRVRDPNTFWCSFQLYKQQMEPPPRLVETVMHLVNFRTTLAYHIRTGRTYMHGIMRKRVESSLQWLNKAKARVAEETKITIT